TTVLNGEQAEIVLPDGLFDSERNMQVQLTLADNSTGVILGIQDLISIKVSKNIAHNGIVAPVYDVLINDLYEDTKKYLKQLEEYSVTTPNGGNAEFLRGFPPSKFGTKEEADFNLLATLGIPYGGILNNSLAKVAGTAYYDQTGKKIYKCIANTSLNYADAVYFEAISNNDLNCFEYFELENWVCVRNKKTKTQTVRNIEPIIVNGTSFVYCPFYFFGDEQTCLASWTGDSLTTSTAVHIYDYAFNGFTVNTLNDTDYRLKFLIEGSF
ncbi:MAG: hypothetical protein ACRCZ2_03350, partial [Fusobacteriaceae bacterium]